jgi:predicted DNA binding CopG/RHH family protein
MQYFDPQDLSKEEQAELAAIENGEFVEVPNFAEEKAKAESAAKAALNKTRNINIRLSERDLYKLKAKAIEEGIPYQTLASSILHKSTATKK